jgi:hypothetical protein
LQRYYIAQNYIILHWVIQRLSQHIRVERAWNSWNILRWAPFIKVWERLLQWIVAWPPRKIQLTHTFPAQFTRRLTWARTNKPRLCFSSRNCAFGVQIAVQSAPHCNLLNCFIAWRMRHVFLTGVWRPYHVVHIRANYIPFRYLREGQ